MKKEDTHTKIVIQKPIIRKTFITILILSIKPYLKVKKKYGKIMMIFK